MGRTKVFLARAMTAVLTVGMLIAPNGVSIANAATRNTDKANVSYKQEAKQSIENKIDANLKAQFKKGGKVTFLVKLKDQVDTNAVAQSAKNKANAQKLSAAKSELTVRSEIVSELKIKAQETQTSLKKYLDSEKKKGNVEKYQSFYIVNAMSITATKEVMQSIAALPEVALVSDNKVVQLDKVEKSKNAPTANPNSVEWNIDKIGAPAVWALGIDGTGVVVGSIDTGVQWNHPALKTKYRGYDPSNPDTPSNTYNWLDATAGQTTPYDDLGHGTHTMGTMVGSDGGANQVGVAPGARWIAAKAFTSDGGSSEDLLEAGQWMIAPTAADGTTHPEMAPDVINNSWGGGAGLNEWFRPMVQAWRNAGIFPEFSAGNTTLTNPGGPGSVANPANYPECFATGATDINDMLGNFSLRGPSPYNEIKPEVSAPGVNIRSSVPGGSYEGGWDGTSMAGPHVSGLVALLLQANSSLTIDQLETIIMTTAVPRTDAEYPTTPNNGYGTGRIDALSAISSVSIGLGTISGQVVKEGEDTVPPTYQHTPVASALENTAISLTASVQDDVCVETVELQYRSNDADQWQTVKAVRTAGDYRNGDYTAAIPAAGVTAPSVSYRWRIVDFGGNEVIGDYYTVNVIPVIYSQDFETDVTGWHSEGTNDCWQWGAPTSGPNKAASGEKVYATNLVGDYGTGADFSLYSPGIAVPANAHIQFKNWYNFEKNYDKGHVLISTDNTNWTEIGMFTDVMPNPADYATAEFDLSAYAGQTVYLRFQVTTDGSVVRPGWYIDDLKMYTVETPTALNSVKPAPAAKTAGLPMSAKVTVLETGTSVNTNPADGRFSLNHRTGDYTLRAEAYGYCTTDRPITVVKDGEVNVNFMLQELPKGNVSGRITNKVDGTPIADATIYVLEDAAVAPVKTDADGNFSLTAYEGNYTLVIAAPDYYSERIPVTLSQNNPVTQNAQLRPFIGYQGEIGYDDGTGENARAWKAANNAWGVKMSLMPGQTTAIVDSGLFKFWDPAFPTPGGTDFQVAVYDATGANGAPGKMIAGPFAGTAIRDKNAWTRVDLSNEGIVVNGDFYMVYIQTAVSAAAPGLATDENGTNAKRSWQRVSDAWTASPAEEGNYMIRATVKYEASAPVITSPKNNSYTQNGAVTIQGTASVGLPVHVYNNNQEIGTATVGTDGKFSLDVQLQQGPNVLKACSTAKNGSTDFSKEVKVTFDNVAPVLTITSPVKNAKINTEVVEVTGTIQEANLKSIKVNGTTAKVTDGTYSARIILSEGKNTIKVVATDKAGSSVTKKVTVYSDFTAPVISNVQPYKDMHLKAGESVKIQFNAEPGIRASFKIHMPLVNTGKINVAPQATTGDSVVEFPMWEDKAGHYVGYWTATSNLVAAGAQIEVIARDSFDNTSRQMAKAKLYINTEE